MKVPPTGVVVRPLALLGGVFLFFRERLHFPLGPIHRGLVLWGGWLVTATVFFSVAQFFHPYYLIILGPALAALVAMSAASLWQLYRKRPWIALLLMAIAAVVTLAFQSYTVSHLYVMDADGSHPACLTCSLDRDARSPVWAFDGKTISVDDHADVGGTIGYEVLTSLKGRYTRQYVETAAPTTA